MDQGSSNAGRAGDQETWSEAFLRARETLSEGRAFRQVQETLSVGQVVLLARGTESGELAGSGQQFRGQGKGEMVEVRRNQRQGISDGHPEDRILDQADPRASLGDHQGP